MLLIKWREDIFSINLLGIIRIKIHDLIVENEMGKHKKRLDYKCSGKWVGGSSKRRNNSSVADIIEKTYECHQLINKRSACGHGMSALRHCVWP